jgi:VanZ family protein
VAERPPARRDFVLFMRYWLPVLVYATAVLVVGGQPNLRPPVEFHFADKFYHLLEYGGLGFLLARAIRATLRVGVPLFAALMAAGLGGVLGLADELHQLYVPGRQCDMFDLMADVVGVLLAQLVFVLVHRRRD